MEEENLEYCNIRRYKKLYLIIVFTTFFIMQITVAYHPFWGDEIAQIGFVGDSANIMQSIGFCLTGADITPPLFNILSNIWYRLVPNTERFLLLFTEIIVCISIYLNAIIGLKLRNPRIGLYICILMGTSVTLFDSVAFEFRTYALFLFFSTITLFIHTNNRTEHVKDTYGKYILFTCSLMGLLFSHYYAIFIFIAYFFADMYLLLNKKTTFKVFAPYILAGIPFFIWCVGFIIKKQDTSFFGDPNLNFNDFLKALCFLLGNNAFVYILFLFATALVLSRVLPIFKKAKDKTWSEAQFYFNFFVITIWGMIGILYFYGAFIPPQYVVFGNRIMIPRYFTGLMPFAVFACADILDNVFQYIIASNGSKCRGYLRNGCIAIYLGLTINLLQNVAVPNCDPYNAQNTYNRASSWLLAQKDIFDEDTLVISVDSRVQTNGFVEHYFEKSKQEGTITVKSMWEIQETDYKQYNTIYLFGIWGIPEVESQPIISFLGSEYKMIFSDNALKLRAYEQTKIN